MARPALRSVTVDRVDEINTEWTFVKKHAVDVFYAGLVLGLEILDQNPKSEESRNLRTSLRAAFDGSSQKAVQNLGHLLTFVFQLVATDQPLWQACDKCSKIAREKGVKYYYNTFIPSLEPYEKKEPSSEEEEDTKQYASFIKGVARCWNPNCGQTATQWTDANQFCCTCEAHRAAVRQGSKELCETRGSAEAPQGRRRVWRRPSGIFFFFFFCFFFFFVFFFFF
jgi:hypothetical protein